MKGNEPAFPIEIERGQSGNYYRETIPGLTKREYFAAMAMQGFCACPDMPVPSSDAKIAALAVKMADALIAELNKE